MKYLIITLTLVLSFIGLYRYFDWYLHNFHMLTNAGAGGLGVLSFIIMIVVLIALPFTIADIFKNDEK